MSRIDAIRARAAAADQRLSFALATAAPRWDELAFLEDPGAPRPGQRSSWSARDIAEHVLSVESLNLKAAASSVEDRIAVDLRTHMRALTDWDWGNRSYDWMSFEAADGAMQELEKCRSVRDRFLEVLEEAHLGFETGMSQFALDYMESRNAPVDNNVEGLLIFCCEHMLDHAEQIEATLGAGT